MIPELRPMREDDIDPVFTLESAIVEFPWTRGHFADSLKAGYSGWVCRDAGEDLIGYFILMPCVDEMHLLNIGVTPDRQRQGWGRRLLEQALLQAQRAGMTSLLLEVRPSNHRALKLYAHAGFDEVGRRKGYYPATHGREDALVMRRLLSDAKLELSHAA